MKQRARKGAADHQQPGVTGSGLFCCPMETCAVRPAIYVFASSALLLSACASGGNPSPAQTPAAPQPVKIANPASVFCIQQGGKLRMEKTPQGERMLCILPDGREVDEWDFFRQHHPAPKP